MVLVILGLIAIVAAILAITYYTGKADEADIQKWVSSRDYVVKNIDRRVLASGPYWNTKNYRIYVVDTSHGKYWFRFGIFSPDVYRELDNGEYEKVQ